VSNPAAEVRCSGRVQNAFVTPTCPSIPPHPALSNVTIVTTTTIIIIIIIIIIITVNENKNVITPSHYLQKRKIKSKII
jgi:hypothetical protein